MQGLLDLFYIFVDFSTVAKNERIASHAAVFAGSHRRIAASVPVN